MARVIFGLVLDDPRINRFYVLQVCSKYLCKVFYVTQFIVFLLVYFLTCIINSSLKLNSFFPIVSVLLFDDGRNIYVMSAGVGLHWAHNICYQFWRV